MMRLIEVGVVLLASRSKSRQKVEESSKVEKSQRPEKSQRLSVRRNVYQRTNPLSIRYAPIRALMVFQALFARPRSSLDTIFESITDKAKRVELLMLCHVFPQRSQDEEEVLGHFGHLLFEFNPATPSSYQRSIRPPLLFQFWKCASEEDVQAQD